MKPLKNYFPVFLVFLVLGFAVVFLAMRYWPVHVMNITKLETVGPGPFAVGDTMLYSMSYCKDPKYATLQAEVSLSFVDHLIYDLATTHGNIPTGCTVSTFALRVPPVAPGRYHIEMRRIYSVSAIRPPIEIDAKTAEFDVAPSPNRREREKLIEENGQLIGENGELIGANKRLVELNKALIVRIDRMLVEHAAR
jgi:hypothetical protein